MKEAIIISILGTTLILCGYWVGKNSVISPEVTSMEEVALVEPGDTIISGFAGYSLNIVLEVKGSIALVKRQSDFDPDRYYQSVITLDYYLERGFLHKRKK